MKLPAPLDPVWCALKGLSGRYGVEIAGYIAFTVMLALFPFLIFLVSLAGFFGATQTGGEFIDTMALFAPPDMVQTLKPALDSVTQHRDGGILTVGLFLALYSAASGVAALRTALNLSYGLNEQRPFWLRKLQDFLIVVVGSVVAILTSVIIILGPWLWNVIAWFGFMNPDDKSLWPLGRYAFTLVFMTLAVIALHRVLPDRHIRFRHILPGAIATTVLWTIAASGLTLYFGRFANYATTYGSLGGVIVTLMFFYVSAIIFIFGGEYNAALMVSHSKPGPAPNMELRPSPANS